MVYLCVTNDKNMSTVKEILTANRDYVIANLNRLFPAQSISISMTGFMEYCNSYELNNEDEISSFLNKYRQQETSFANIGKSNDINDLTKYIRNNSRNRWGI